MSFGKLYILQYRPGGEIIVMDPDGSNRRSLLGNLFDNVDGIIIDNKTNTLYWTNMGPAIGPKEGEFLQAGRFDRVQWARRYQSPNVGWSWSHLDGKANSGRLRRGLPVLV